MTKIIVAIHGWPDSPKLFDPLSKLFIKNGYEFYSIYNHALDSDSVNKGIDKIIKQINKLTGDKPIILLGHDWGSFLSNTIALRYQNEYKLDKISKMIMLDVGTSVYVWWWLLFFITWQGLGILAYFFRSKKIQLFLTSLLGCPKPTTNYKINRIFLCAFDLNKWKSDEIPCKPTLFIHGNGYMKFYTNRFIDYVQNTKSCAYHVIDGGHWFFLNKPKKTYNIMQTYLRKE
jgi:pimeloyl-ACP methyl ester carboxylesterase